MSYFIVRIGVLMAAAMGGLHAGQLFLQVQRGGGLPDLEGSVHLNGFEGWIEATAFGNGFSRSAPTTTKGTPRRTVPGAGAFSFVKPLDKSSPLLADALIKGTVFPNVIVVYRQTGNQGLNVETARVELRQVTVSEYSMVASNLANAALPMDEIGLTFEEVRWIYNVIDRNDRVAESTEMTFDALLGSGNPNLDSDKDGLTNDIDPDDDNDGMPDIFELAAGLDPTFPGAELDFDGDGQSNLGEYASGSDPDDPNSRFAIDSIGQRMDTPDIFTMTFQILPGRRYFIQSSADGRNWYLVNEFAVAWGSEETEAEVEVPYDEAMKLYRVEVQAE